MDGQTLEPADILATLDDEQREVAQTLRGPVRVLAGAGTGKTRAIIGRIAFGVATGTYSPDSVMAITFTQRAAGEMRTRLRSLGVERVAARTFHASALSQLNYFWPQLTGSNAPRVLESKARALAEVSTQLGLKLDTATLRDLAAEIEWRKVSNLTVDAYALVPDRPRPPALGPEEVIDVQRAYEALKDERGQIDFEDVLLLTVGMLEAESQVAMRVREQYRFFTVDEYQDVSPLQHRMLELWRGDREDLCVVGDVSQTIYSFTGATSDYLQGFESEFPRATTIRLEANYRSTTPIVAAANGLMRQRDGALELHSVVAPAARGDAKPTLIRYESDRDEAYSIAASIRAQIQSGVPAQSIAILYRINAQSAVLESALLEADVPYHVAGSTRFFDLPDVRRALLALRGAAVAPTSEPLFKSVSDVVRSLGWTQSPPEAGGAVRSKWEALNALVEMADSAPRETTLGQFAADLQARADAKHDPTPRAVTLASIHSAKGLEWEVVYVVGLSDGILPISYATSERSIDEERRLLYVAVTRAKRMLHLSWGASRGASQTPHRPSRFLAEFGTNTLREVKNARSSSDPSVRRV